VVRASARRPLPALAFLLGLSLLTALVWWRVIHRVDSENKPKAQSSCPSTAPARVVPQPSAVTLSVLNSTTTRNGLAAGASASLRKLGFKVGSIGNDSSGVLPGVGEIRYGTAGKAGATLVSYYLPGATLVPSSRSDAVVEVSLGLKYTKIATAAQVKAALAAAHISQAAAAPRPVAKTPTPVTTRSTAHC
jgi:LytR cell envelope-related transcriptional attenuator